MSVRVRMPPDVMAESTAQVPEELMQQLHHVTDRFHAAREELERSMDATEYGHEVRVATAADRLRDAEREVERVEDRIKQVLAGDQVAAPVETAETAAPAEAAGGGA
jgi:hypothetical protein